MKKFKSYSHLVPLQKKFYTNANMLQINRVKIVKIKPIFCYSSALLLIILSNPVDNFKQYIFKDFQSSVLAQESTPEIVKTGTEVIINNRTYNLPWIQWQEGDNLHIGMADMGLEKVLGIELLSTNQHQIQPIRWFAYYKNLPAKFINPYRYLDITEFAKIAKINLKIEDNQLNINIPLSQVKKAYQSSEFTGEKIVVELDRPSFWQFSKGKEQAIITIQGEPLPELITEFQPIETIENLIREEEGDEVTPIDEEKEDLPLFTVEKDDNQTLIKINIPSGKDVRVNSANPNLLFIDIKPDAMVEREITWSSDIFLQQKYIAIPQQDLSLNSDLFFVSYLTIDIDNYNLDFRPITTNSNSMIGTAPLSKTAQNLGAITAINGGFFNRKNKLPLGVIKSKNNWLSGPILNRGVIGWNEINQFQINRLKLQETITTFKGDRFVINYLNSGYIEPGISRYNPDWGLSYTTLTDDEIVIVVEKDQVKEQLTLGKAGEDTVSIPKQGYLLTIRKEDNLASKLEAGMKLKLDSFAIPNEFGNLPNIMGAGPLLILDGQIVLDGEAEKFSSAFNNQKASRSAIGLTRDKKLLLVAVHNRIGGNGPSLLELAKIMNYLGAVNALNLDGGSSTQIYLGGQIIDRSPATASSVHNGIGIFLRSN